MDVELSRAAGDPHRWEGVYRIPASQLANAAHADVQLVFKGAAGGGLQWDNNAGKNWQARAKGGRAGGLAAAGNGGLVRMFQT